MHARHDIANTSEVFQSNKAFGGRTNILPQFSGVPAHTASGSIFTSPRAERTSGGAVVTSIDHTCKRHLAVDKRLAMRRQGWSRGICREDAAPNSPE